MTDTEIETVDAFVARAETWLAANMPPRTGELGMRGFGSDEEELASVAEARRLQRTLFDGGFAGICFPREYGGQGLPVEYQLAFNRACAPYEMPRIFNVPTFVPCAAVLLEFGTEEQKQQHIPAILKGEELWMQFLSEPSGGSDVAGALTTAVRDGDEWVINGSKVWTTGAWWSDYGLCLLRTNWDVPKHQGLSVFIIKIRQPDIEVQRIEMINGSKEFCQEFMTDLRISDDRRVGEVDDGWTIGRRWMFHERNAMGGGSPYVSGPAPGHAPPEEREDSLVALARDTGRLDDPRARDLIGEARALQRAGTELSKRIGAGMAAGTIPETAASIARLMGAVVGERTTTIQLELAGPAGAAWDADDPAADLGMRYLMRQANSIGGGTTEMARNNISERVLGMPRERTLDKDVAFREVPKGPPASG
ncbi:MAG: acyl-CoA dehydrogenase family protein [Acidimicrobiales bacterium]|jgi:alkylation response protein AidB-like acyl-CoA dehydrogenase|nr:acyl-CoA dehydrogenase family protein [Acidimicrobiales bacterium]